MTAMDFAQVVGDASGDGFLLILKLFRWVGEGVGIVVGACVIFSVVIPLIPVVLTWGAAESLIERARR